MRLLFILPFYGSLPRYFGFFLKSIEDRCFDMLFVSDLELPWVPKNVRVIRMQFTELQALMSLRLGVPVRLDSYRRLCDFKPMYGKIFEGYLCGYDYWAHGDCDLVFGCKMDSFLRDVLARDFDVISLRKYWMSGPFGIYRNRPLTNGLYRRAVNWEEIAQMPGNRNDLIFDECGGNFHQKLAHREMTPADCAAIRDNMLSVLARSDDVNWYHEDIIEECKLSSGRCVAMAPDGHLCLNNQEIPIFHYIGIKFKRKFYDNCPIVTREGTTRYLIDDAGFYVGRMRICFRHALRIVRICLAVIVALKNGGIRRVLYFLKNGL